MKYLENLQYIFLHKWCVLIECFKVKLYWQGIAHDLSKLLPSEFIPYTAHFYGKNKIQNRHDNFYVPGNNFDFDIAWLKHIHRNPHHWQYWIIRQDDGERNVLPMPHKYRLEMLCDWQGAGKSKKNYNTATNWYQTNKYKMILHPSTREWIEKQLKI